MPLRATTKRPSTCGSTTCVCVATPPPVGSSRAARLAPGVAWLALVLAGCQGGAQSDVVERELRWQEDQIYAMEDYISEYQQLLCEYRSENSALKRQLIHNGSSHRRPRSAREQVGPNADEEEMPPPSVPSLEDTMPGLEGQPEGSGGVYPLEDYPLEDGPNLEFRPARRPSVNVRRTALELPSEPLEQSEPVVDPEEPSAASLLPEDPVAPYTPTEPLHHVVVHGDVLPESGQTGPRLLANVRPLAASGRAAAFEGAVSLMVLDSSGEKPRGVARWDFAPEQLAQLFPDGVTPTMEFPLQLPADTPIEQPLELWVRLVPTGGAKKLAHAELDLQQAGHFSSVRPRLASLGPVDHDEPETKPTGAQSATTTGNVSLSVGDWNGWEVARPGQKPPSREGARQPQSSWRRATQPIPALVNQGRPVRPKRAETRATDLRVARRAEPDALQPSAWSPERAGDSAETDAAKTDSSASPSPWSPVR